jgi:hypothetical protein
MGSYRKFLHIEFYMNNKQRAEKKSIGDRARRLGEFWSMLEHFGVLWS